jgi:hypothetical protein
MSERDLRGTWNKKPKKVAKSSSFMIGMIYEGVDKFFGKRVVGVLMNIYTDNDEAVLRTEQGVFASVDKQSLKIVTV